MTILLAGATGLVGAAVIEAARDTNLTVVTVGRRRTGRVANEIVADFDNLPPLPTADRAICTLGTTIKAAGSRAAFKVVDKTAVLAFAEASRQAGVSHFLIVTAVGADPKSSVFYSRVKGEAEAGLAAMGFRRLDILRPGLLLGERTETRRVEQLLQRLAPVTDHLMPGPLARYRSIPAATLAGTLLALCAEKQPGVHCHEGRNLHDLGRSAISSSG